MNNKVKLSTIAKQIRGVSYKPGDLSPSPGIGFIPLLRATNIKENNTLDLSQLVYVAQSKVNNEQYLQTGDILIAASSGSIDVVGKAGTYEGSDVLTFGAFCKLIRPNQELANPKYIAFFFQTNYYRKRISFLAQGANINNLRNEHVNNLEIPFPDIETQNKIVTVLEKAKSLVDKRENAIQLLNNFLEATFLEMFGIKNPDFHHWVEITIESLKKKKQGSMRTGPFGSNLKHERFKTSGEVAVIGIDNAVDNVFKWKQKRFLTLNEFSEFKNYQVFPRDVIITIMGTVGRSAVIPENIGLAINTKHLAAITLDESKCNPYYLAYSIHSNPFIKYQLKTRSRGAIMDGFNLTLIKELKLKQAPISLQNKFETIFKKHTALIEKYGTYKSQSESIFSAISKLAFSGKLTFNVAVELEVLLEKDYDFFKSKSTQKNIQLLLERLEKNELNDKRFYEEAVYNKAKYFVFELLKEGKIKQVYDEETKSIKLSI